VIENNIGFEDDMMNFCFGSSSKSCFEFDGTTSTAITLMSKHDHARGGLGVYKKQLFAIGGGVMNSDTFNNKLEFLGRTSWVVYDDFPKNSGIADMTIVSVMETDQAFLFGGYDGQDLQSDVYEMLEDSVNQSFRFQYITRLLKPLHEGSAVLLGMEVLLAGAEVQRMNLLPPYEVVELGELDPILDNAVFYEVEADICLNSCDEFCFDSDHF